MIRTLLTILQRKKNMEPATFPVRTYTCNVIGDGSEFDPTRPEITSVGGIQRWEMLDDQDGGLPQGRMLVRVYASLSVHNQIELQTNATLIQ